MPPGLCGAGALWSAQGNSIQNCTVGIQVPAHMVGSCWKGTTFVGNRTDVSRIKPQATGLPPPRPAAVRHRSCVSGGGGGSRTQKHSEAGYGRPVDRGAWTAQTVKRPQQQPAHPQYANYWAPLTRKRHIPPHSAQPQHTNHWAPRTRKRHQQEHRSQRPTERSDPTQHAKGRTGDCPGPRKETAT